MDVSEIEPVDVEKVQEENPQSRFRVLNNANLPPGVCALCGSAGGGGRQFIDFGKTVDWFGAVYFCTFCVAEAATLLGFVNHGHVDQIVAAHNEMVERYNELLSNSVEMENAARLLLRNCHCDPVINGDSYSPVVEIPEANVIDDESADSDESDADESDPVEGSNDISADSGSDDESDSKPVRRTRKSAG